MRLTSFRATRVAALVAVLAILGPVAATPSSANAAAAPVGNTIVQLKNTTPCQDFVFLGLRGSGETSTQGKWGMGTRVTPVYDSFIASMSNRRIAATGIDYASAGVPVLESLTVWAGIAWDGYFASIDGGVHSTEATLINRANKCPAERFVLAGYSQGAMVIHRVVFDLSRAPQGGILSKIIPRIIGVATVGDGDRVPRDDVVNLGTAPVDSKGGGVGVALSSGNTFKSTLQRLSAVGHGLNARWFQVCDRGDIVCDFGRAAPVSGYRTHTESYTSRNGAIATAGRELARLSMNVNPLSVSYSQTSAIVGVPYVGTFTQTSGYTLTSIVLISGSLPWGVTFSGVNGLGGTPAESGLWSFTYRATDRVGQTFTATKSILVAPVAGQFKMAVRAVAVPIPAQHSSVGYDAPYHVYVKNLGPQRFWPGMLTSECSIPTLTYGTTGLPPLDWSYVSPGEEWAWDCWHTLTQADVNQGFYTATGSVFGSSDSSNVANTVVIPTQTATIRPAVPVQMLRLTASGVPITRYQTQWVVTLKNTGNRAVTAHAIDSNRCGSIPLADTSLVPGESVTATCVSTVTESYLGGWMNQVHIVLNVTAHDAAGAPYSAMLQLLVDTLS